MASIDIVEYLDATKERFYRMIVPMTLQFSKHGRAADMVFVTDAMRREYKTERRIGEYLRKCHGHKVQVLCEHNNRFIYILAAGAPSYQRYRIRKGVMHLPYLEGLKIGVKDEAQ